MGIFNRKTSIAKSGLLKGATDRHSHILYGVDDGIRDLVDSLACLEYYEKLGVADLWLTPHIMEDVPNTTERLKARFNELCKSYQGPIRLHLAAEYMMDSLLLEKLAAHDLLTMEDNIVLVETSTWRAPEDWLYFLEKIQAAGYKPLFAHVERYQYLKAEDYDKLYRMGIRMQLNYGSLTGFYGETAQRKSRELLAKGYYSYCGSDCHRLHNVEKQFTSDCLKKAELSLLRDCIR